ncbi:preprotein translocase subunit SecG [Marinobacter sp. F4216]|uniref:preprotein translocase subunit SecG n=1 Tax=Marinobacter sp. F4216 TaxID=2874281 RepID=UPI001CC02350|nr:preprotein translocase subunit SecG [Marinobacter sp. F4216]MBZ2169012.1 preprotein translocase subunit SecG [Marinobacter sp. F4216]
MDWMETLVVVVHVVIAIALVGLVLIQQGKGADAGAAFGGGASQTVFGSQGSGSFLTRLTTMLAIVFFVTSFSLAVFAKQRAEVAGEAGIPVVEESSDETAPSAQPAEDESGVEVDLEGEESGLPELE